MTSQPRAQRPAATDYFNPAEQLELLQNIKVKAQKSTTATPQESHPRPATGKPSSETTTQPVDYVAHELSLREKLEKAKAEREAKAKVEAALRGNAHNGQTASITASTNANTDASQDGLVKGSIHPEPTTGPPPPPILNNNANNTPMSSTPTPTPTYGPTWVQSLGYPQQTNPMAYTRTPFPQFPQPSFPPFGMPPFTNGQTMFSPWGQFPPTPTPGIPPPSVPVNQGPPNQTPPTQVASAKPGPLGQNSMNTSQKPPTPGSIPPSQTGIHRNQCV